MIFPQEYHIMLLYKSLDLGKGHIICGLAITCVCLVPTLLSSYIWWKAFFFLVQTGTHDQDLNSKNNPPSPQLGLK